MSNNPDVSIIIINYNSKSYLKNCLKSIYKHTTNVVFDVLVLDNHSTDDLSDLVEKDYPQIKYIKNNINVGFGVANNIGIRMTTSKYIFLLNPDTLFLNDIINIFFEFMEDPENQNIWVVGGQLFDEDGIPAKSYGRFPNLFDVILEQFGIKGILLKLFKKKITLQRNLLGHTIEVPFVMGCNMFVRRSALKKIGLFNNKFFLNFEETELSWRAKKAGFKSMILPNAKIIHFAGKSFLSKKEYLQHLWYGQLLFFKYTRNNFFLITVKLLQTIGALARWIVKGDDSYLSYAKKVIKQ